MSSREKILAKLRRQIVDQAALPEVVQGDWLRFEDPVEKFAEMVKFAGGSCVQLAGLEQLPGELAKFDEWKSAQRILSAIPEVLGNVDIEATPDPHEPENLDFVVYPGEFAVAKNGAFWLTDRQLRQRVIFFITQFLVLVVRKESILNNMHEALSTGQCAGAGFRTLPVWPKQDRRHRTVACDWCSWLPRVASVRCLIRVACKTLSKS